MLLDATVENILRFMVVQWANVSIRIRGSCELPLVQVRGKLGHIAKAFFTLVGCTKESMWMPHLGPVVVIVGDADEMSSLIAETDLRCRRW